jgi:hypothetical protein
MRFQYEVRRDDTTDEGKTSEALVAVASVNDPPVPKSLMEVSVDAGNHTALIDFSTGADPIDDDVITQFQIVSAATHGCINMSTASNLTGSYKYTADPTTAPGNGEEILDHDTLTFKLVDSAGTVSRVEGRVNVTVYNSLRAVGGAEFRDWRRRAQVITFEATDGSSTGRSLGYQVQPGSIGGTSVGRLYGYSSGTGAIGDLVCNTLGTDGDCADAADAFVTISGDAVAYVPADGFANRPFLRATSVDESGSSASTSEWGSWCLKWMNASTTSIWPDFNPSLQTSWPDQCKTTVNTQKSTAQKVPEARRKDVKLTFRTLAADGTLAPSARQSIWVDEVPSAAKIECGSEAHADLGACEKKVFGRTDALSKGVPLAFTVPSADVDDTSEWMVVVKAISPNGWGNFWIAENYRKVATMTAKLDFNSRTDAWCTPVKDRFDGFSCEGASGEAQSVSHSMVFFGLPSDVKAALEGLTYYWGSDEPGEDEVTVTVFNTMQAKAGISPLVPSTASRKVTIVRVGAEPTNAPTAYPTVSLKYKLSSDITLEGFVSPAAFTTGHRNAFKNTMSLFSEMSVGQINITSVATSLVRRQLEAGDRASAKQRQLAARKVVVNYQIRDMTETQRGAVPAKIDSLTNMQAEIDSFLVTLRNEFTAAGASVPGDLGLLASSTRVEVQSGEVEVPADDTKDGTDCVDTTGLGCSVSDCDVIGCQIPWPAVFVMLAVCGVFTLYICMRFAGDSMQKCCCYARQQYQLREGYLEMQLDSKSKKVDKWVVLRKDTLSHWDTVSDVKSVNKSSPNNLMLTDGTTVRDHGSSALFMVMSENKIWKCTASSMDDKNKWILAIEQNGRLKNMKKNATVKRKEKGTTMMQWMSRKSSLFGSIRRTSSITGIMGGRKASRASQAAAANEAMEVTNPINKPQRTSTVRFEGGEGTEKVATPRGGGAVRETERQVV